MNHDEAATQQVKCLGSWFGGSTDKKTLPTHTHTHTQALHNSNKRRRGLSKQLIYLSHSSFFSLSLSKIHFFLSHHLSLFSLSPIISIFLSLLFSSAKTVLGVILIEIPRGCIQQRREEILWRV